MRKAVSGPERKTVCDKGIQNAKNKLYAKRGFEARGTIRHNKCETQEGGGLDSFFLKKKEKRKKEEKKNSYTPTSQVRSKMEGSPSTSGSDTGLWTVRPQCTRKKKHFELPPFASSFPLVLTHSLSDLGSHVLNYLPPFASGFSCSELPSLIFRHNVGLG